MSLANPRVKLSKEEFEEIAEKIRGKIDLISF
ncbi:hypothetical protein SDC9_159301 [bioreactor metagenome]|uniref:Uncharacterized protein n=1 Tax=bioreactor metagenome TaxID=1076179 RepID=A0A645FET4_9ZZZZ